MPRFLKFMSSMLLASLFSVSAVAQTAEYVAASWDDDRIHLLDADFESISDFAAGASNPNGIAFDGQYIYSGHFGSAEMIAYEEDGTEVFRWSNPEVDSLQALTYIENTNELAINGDTVDIAFLDPADGDVTRTLDLDFSCSGLEGMASDGAGGLWLLCNQGLFLIDDTTGDQIDAVGSPTTGTCDFNGTGIAPAAGGLLALGCTNGDWFLWNPDTESVVESGNNGIQMYGLAPLGLDAPPPPTTDTPISVPAGSMVSWTILALILLLAAGFVLRRRGENY